jgi:hypothetical protein
MSELEEFLRQAMERRRQRAQQAAQTPPQRRSTEQPISRRERETPNLDQIGDDDPPPQRAAPVVDLGKVAKRKGKRPSPSQGGSSQSGDLTGGGFAPDKPQRHTIGERHSSDERISVFDEGGFPEIGDSVIGPTELSKYLAEPKSLQTAFILSEVFRRPNF